MVAHFFVDTIISLLVGGIVSQVSDSFPLGFIAASATFVYLIIAYMVAKKFAEIAEMKGHDGDTYFWFTYCLGICGMLMVIALPDNTKK